MLTELQWKDWEKYLHVESNVAREEFVESQNQWAEIGMLHVIPART